VFPRHRARVAEHGPVILVGHSLGGSTLTRVANTAPDLLFRIVYLSAYCCVASPTVPSYAPAEAAPESPLGRARRIALLGNPTRTGVSRTNPRTGDPDMFAVQHALLMADLEPAHVQAVLAYATQPDEPLQVILANAQVDPDTRGRLPRSYIRTSHDEVIRARRRCSQGSCAWAPPRERPTARAGQQRKAPRGSTLVGDLLHFYSNTPQLLADLESVTWTVRRADLQDEPTLSRLPRRPHPAKHRPAPRRQHPSRR